MSVLDYAKPKLTKTMLRAITLRGGGHRSRETGLCVMEAVAWAAGRDHSDHPPCVSNVIGAFLRNWNDNLDDEGRQMLKPYVFKVIGTATNAKDEETRAWLATDWLVRECAPAWLRLAGLTAQAETLENLAALTNGRRAKSAQKKLDVARKDAYAAGDAAWAAARAAAGAAAWDAAWAAARAALEPTTKGLQKSALGLLDRMIEVGQ